MAIGSNSLGLMFKIGVDAGDATKQIQQLISQMSGPELKAASAQIAQAVTQLNAALKQSKDLTAEQRAEYQAVIETLKQYKTQIDETAKALERNTTSSKAFHTELNQVKNGLTNIAQGNFGSAIGQIGSAMATATASGNALIIALAVIAVAVFAAIEAFKGMSKAIEDIGTKSKDDFQQLQSDLKAVNFQLTLADHALSQEVLKSFKNVESAVTAFMAVLLREAGPALIVLLNDIGALLIQLLPLAKQLGAAISEGFIQAIAAAQALAVWVASHDISLTWKVYRQAVQSAREEVEKLSKSLQGKTGVFAPSGTEAKVEDDPIIKLAQQRKELADAVAKAEKQTFDDTTLEIQRQLQAREISFKDAVDQQQAAADRYRKALQDQVAATRLYNDIIFQAQEKRKQTALEQQIADQEDVNRVIDNQRKVTDSERKTNADLAKIEEDRLAQTKKVADEESKIIEQVIKERARAAQPVPGGGGTGPIPGAPPPIPLPKVGIFDELGDALKNSGAAFTTWSDFASKAISGVAGATENLLETFILTGKGGGQAFKQLAASIVASLVVEAAVRALMEVAYGIADLAKAATLAADPLTAALAPGFVASAHVHFAAAQQFGIIAGVAAAAAVGIGAAGGLGGGAKAAAGDGQFGGAQPPGPVTINQGGGGPLGIQLQQLNALNNISNTLSTASPGDVVTRGAEQNPVAIGQANNEAARRDGTVSREFLQISGLRTA